MNEQRLQAYQQLIQQLLSCPSQEEAEIILAANAELLDAGFLQVVVGVAGMFTQEGQENTANWLLALASQLSEGLGIPLDGNTPEPETTVNESDIDTYLQFLLAVLQATAESQGNPQVIYPLLAANTDKLNLTFAQLLQVWATKKLEEAEPDAAKFLAAVIVESSNLIRQFPLGNKADNMEIAITGCEIGFTVFTRYTSPALWAGTQNNLGLAYLDRIKGDKADNLECAIAAYTAALEISTRTDFPVDWAATQNNLSLAYWNRIKGDKAENLEYAIAAYTAALEVRTRTNFPGDWAATQNNLGNAYRDKIRGDKAENIEYAIAAYTACLEVYTRTSFPVQWAMAQNNLGSAYSLRIRGNKAENLEYAIAAFTAGLEVYTRTDFPVDWAMTQSNLGNAYSLRIRGNKSENLEIAIAAFTAVLEVYTRTDFPVDWATTQDNLGNAYLERIRGDKAENLEYAIAAYNEALEISTRTDFPVDWAMTQNNLGNAYLERIRGDKAENLEYAIAAYNEALEISTRTDFPVDWAMTQNNLGNTYRDRIRGDKTKNLEYAIAACTQALEVYTRTDFPEKWAVTQNNLGNAYLYRIRGDKAENLEYAIAAYENALEVHTRTDFPVENAQNLSNLGIAYQDSQQLNLAYDTFKSAIVTVEDIRGEIISGEESKRKQAEKWNQLFIRMVEVCLALGKETEAITYIERSKTRNLVEQILSRDLKTIFPGDVVTQLEKLRDEIASGQNLLQTGKAENANLLRENLQDLRQESQQLQDQYLPIGASFEFASLQNIVDNKTAIIEWYIASDKIIAVVIQPGGKEIKIWQSSSEDREALRDWINEYLNDYYNQKDQWQNQLEESLQNLAAILHIEEILQKIPPQCQKLILIPHQFLHLLPLHALPARNSYLMDLFPEGVGYAPSCQLLQQAQLRQRDNFQSLFAIQTPTKDLYETDLGAVAAIRKQFHQSNILKKDKAKKSAIIANNTNLSQANNLFLFCHGEFDDNSPLDSRLLLADSLVYSESVEKSPEYYGLVSKDILSEEQTADRNKYLNPLIEKLIEKYPKRYKFLSKDEALDLNECLTLADIITNIKLDNCRLVTLAACETGITDFTSTSDEYIGLPSGFLLAGSTNVVSSLWEVHDQATALLMVKFYEELQHENNLVLALRNAQIWLRDTNILGFKQWLPDSSLDADWKEDLKEYFSKEEQEQGSNVQIFASPFYWSAFCAIGKGV